MKSGGRTSYRLKAVLLVVMTVVGAMTSHAQLREKYYVVKMYDHAKEMTLEVKSSSELKALEKECRFEARYWGKALTLTQKEWKKIKGNERTSFPRGTVTQKKFVKASPACASEEQAAEKLSKYLDSVARKKERDEEREEKRKEKEKEKEGKSYERKEKKRKAKEARKNAFDADARYLFDTQMTELMEEATRPAKKE